MPDIDGWTFFEDVRRRKETEAVPFVFLTTERELPQRLRGLNLGADDYMTKPFAVEELFVRIERLLERNATIKRAQGATGDALLSGSVEHLAISDLLQLLALNGKEGIVQLVRGDDVGRIEFVSGRIVDAQVGSARGTKALFRILGWTDATFRVLARGGEAPERTIGATTSMVLMDGVVSLDEWSRWVELLPESDSRLALAEDARSKLEGRPLRPVEYDVLARAKAGVTVAQAIEQSPYTDAAVAESICTLLARGIMLLDPRRVGIEDRHPSIIWARMPALPSVLMVFTGGTISMKIVPGRGAVPARSGREILEQVPQLASLASITCEDFDRLPGPHWSPERMFALAQHLDLRLAAGTFAGAVVTHGTDTLEETAYLLDLVLRTQLPVVLTGAMRTADDPGWDGPSNLIGAVRAVTGWNDPSLGVAVTMAGMLHAARRVTKSHTESYDAFTSSDGGPETRERIETDRIETQVDLITAAAGADAKFLRHAVATGARGIVIQALGKGNVPPAMLEGVREACAAAVPVVVASRCARGATAASYGYEGGGVTLKDAGAIFSGDLSAPKARIKLMVLLGAGCSPDAIRASFERPAA